MRALLSTPTITYCEPIREGLIKRPWAALSNAAFFFTGVLILAKGKGSMLSKLFGSVALLVGLCSTIYDVTYVYAAQLLDLSAMLVFVSLLLFLNMRALSVKSTKLVGLLVAGIVASVAAIIMFQGYSGDIIFGVYVLLVIISELVLVKRKLHVGLKQWLFALSLFVIGFILWIPDNKQLVCFDIGLFNGRAVFHYLCAITIYLLYRYYEQQPRNISSQSNSRN